MCIAGKPLSEHPLHLSSLSELEVIYRGLLVFAFHQALLLVLSVAHCESHCQGEDEVQHSERSRTLLRVLTPVGKMLTSKVTIYSMTDALELFGGFGYLEDTGLPIYEREAQVQSIWEGKHFIVLVSLMFVGTANVLSLDLLRALLKDPSSMSVVMDAIRERLRSAPSDLKDVVAALNRFVVVFLF